MERKENKTTTKMLNSFKSIDLFMKYINFTFDGGKTKFKTVVGATMSLVMMTIILSFFTHNSIGMLKRSNPNVNTYVVYD